MNLEDLKLPLPKIHWRAQSMNREGNSAMALAYMDARDVMDRLDQVCGAANWQDEYVESAKGRVICTISILCDGQWVSKSDGAGNTAVEGEKGGISDAFKRAAVKWGIGRYLYDMKAPWAECTSYKNRQDKLVFKAWTANGLATLRALEPKSISESDQMMLKAIRDAVTLEDLTEWSELHGEAAGQSDNAAAIRSAYRDKMNSINKPQEKKAA